MKLNDILTVKIDNLDHQGRGIARTENGIIFVSNALASETVKVKITSIKKKYFEADILEIIDSSPKRIKPICPYFYMCGGCDLMNMSYDDQLLYKENKVKEIINKFAHLDDSVINPIASLEQYNYRNKVTFQIKNKIGFYEKNSHDIIDIDKCYIINDYFNNLLKLLKTVDYSNFNQVIMRIGENTNETMLVIDSDSLDNKNIIIDLFKDKVTSLIWKCKKEYYTLYGESYIKEKLNDYTFIISPESFFQVNTKMAIKLYDKVLECASLNKNDKVLDLYCGTGTIGIYLSHLVKEVVGIEINEYAIKNANINKAINKTNNITFYQGDATKVIKNINLIPNIIIVDPPRSGLDKEGINHILNINPDRIVYISCDPVTLARDLNLLKEQYDIKEINPFDMFPNTYHVECVVILTKKNN